MKQIILAAGRGSRMKALTQTLPKCMNRLLGKPLIDWQLETIAQCPSIEPWVITGYSAEPLVTHLSSQADLNVSGIHHNPKWNQTNMVGTLLSAPKNFRQEACIVSYGDILYRSQWLQKLVDHEPLSETLATCTYDQSWLKLWSLRFSNPLSDAESFQINSQGKITEIGSRSENVESIQGQFMGLIRIEPKAWTSLEQEFNKNSSLDLTAWLRSQVKQKQTIEGIAIQGGWVEVDSEEDQLQIEKAIQTSEFEHDWRDSASR